MALVRFPPARATDGHANVLGESAKCRRTAVGPAGPIGAITQHCCTPRGREPLPRKVRVPRPRVLRGALRSVRSNDLGCANDAVMLCLQRPAPRQGRTGRQRRLEHYEAA